MSILFEGDISFDQHVVRWRSITDGVGVPGPGWRSFPHFAAMLVTRGSGELKTPTGCFPIIESSWVFVAPDSPHWYGPAAKLTWDEAFVIFDGPLFRIWADLGWLPGQCVVGEPVSQEPLRAVLQAAGDPRNVIVGMQSWLASHLTFGSMAPPREPDWVAQAKAELTKNVAEGIDLQRLASKLGLSYTAFRREFVAKTGCSPHQYRLRSRLAAARDLLTMSALPLRAISDQTGFSDEFHFSNAFKKRFGESPTVYRRGFANEP